MNIVHIHIHATVYLYILYFHAFYFKKFSLKLLSADGMFIFMTTLENYC